MAQFYEALRAPRRVPRDGIGAFEARIDDLKPAGKPAFRPA